MKKPPARLLTVVLIWDSTWKAAAIIKAVRRRQFRWVVPLAIVNSAGMLPMLYLWRFSRPAR
jgi:hypothetical protein